MDPSKNPNDPNRSTAATPTKEPSTPHRKPSVPGLTSLPSVEESNSFLDHDVFSSPEDRSDRFNMALVHGQEELPGTKSRFDERDYQSHRRESFPHTHQPLKPIRSMRKKSSVTAKPSDVEKSEPIPIPSGKASVSLTPVKSYTSPSFISTPNEIVDEELCCDPLTAVVSTLPFSAHSSHEDPASYASRIFDDMMMESYAKKVQFEVGGTPFHGVPEEESFEKKKHKSHRSQKYEDPQWRLRLGSEMKEDSADIPLLLRDPETSEMADLDKDDLTTHRFGDAKGFRRHKFYLREPDVPVATTRNANKYDHKPHEIFVELDILTGMGDDREWKETARWIKYEEDVEEGADRWGRPHVASLSFHSLINLRRLIEAGVILLDLEERDLPGVAYRVVDQMVVKELVDMESKGLVMRSLLLKHKHVNDSEKNWKFNLKRNAGSLTSLQQNSFEEKKGRFFPSSNALESGILQRRNSATVSGSRGLYDSSKRNGSTAGPFLPPENQLQHSQQTVIDFSKLSLAHLSEEDVRWMSKDKENILRRIPAGAEASVVLVGKEESLEGPAFAFVRLAESVYMPNITEVPIPVRFIFILMGPSSYDLDYKEIGRSIATLMSNREFHDIAYKADDRKDLLKGIHEYLDESVVLPPGEYEKELFPFEDLKAKNDALRLRKQRMSVSTKAGGDGGGDGDDGDDMDNLKKLQDSKFSQTDPLRRTRRCFGGLFNDIRRRYPLYWSDIKDGFQVQCVAAIVFIAFAQICGSIAFGGLIGQKTNRKIDIVETLFTSACGGILFSLFSGQPLLIVGTSGPLLLFDESLFSFCNANGIDFLSMRTWIGLWISAIAIVFAGFEGSALVRFFTRFTQEIFASLVCLLFIAESIQNLIQIYLSHPLIKTYGKCVLDPSNSSVSTLESGDPTRNQPNTALLCTILMFGTFYVAWSLRTFRNSRFLTKGFRDTLGNFGVPIAIASMVLVDYLIQETVTRKLDAPKGFHPTSRAFWIVDPGNVKNWVPVVALLPAMLLYILVFMETSIGELIVSKSDHKLKKGSGFHLDVLLICVCNTAISLFGLPWVSVALVRAVAHTTALTVWSTNNPPGEKPKIVGVIEQRLTSFIVSLLTGASVAMASVLEMIPLAVLFGVFLYMGVSSMVGIQFFERVALFFKQVENHPQVPYVRRVRTLKMHLFTLIQIFWLAILWGVKYTSAALSFPFILLILIPFRLFVLKFIFNPDELSALDSSGDEKKEPVIVLVDPPMPNEKQTDTNRNQFSTLLEESGPVDPSSKTEFNGDHTLPSDSS
ncbi:unnamed protein product [Allacma fusca]|uniref:Anion exchange protein n=1 Tax=Allacma fusca TaxID=39272 RepID=A0A8J2LFF5_9HEXA|nr:unnamed protein product [Allacma fusca]